MDVLLFLLCTLTVLSIIVFVAAYLFVSLFEDMLL
jgi:hypothetical protein